MNDVFPRLGAILFSRPNVTCPRCRMRHPSDRTCGDAQGISELARARRQLEKELEDRDLELRVQRQDFEHQISELQRDAERLRTAAGALAGMRPVLVYMPANMVQP